MTVFGHLSPRSGPSPVLAVFLWAAVLAGAAPAETPAPEDGAAEEAFLDLLPPLDLPADIQPIPGARNETFRDCKAYWPEEYISSQTGPEARAYRDIYGLIKVRHVINALDCTCAGKVALWSDVEALAIRLRKARGVSFLSWQDTKSIFEASGELFAVAEALCDGPF